MSQQQPKIVLRPPPHRDYLQGYPGIPASDPSEDSPPLQDPLLQLPHLLRPQAHLSGTVEIRSPAKGPQIRAKWLSLELEKIETIPPQSSAKTSTDKDKGKNEGKFVELIGTGPSRLWIAGEDQGAPVANGTKKKGSKGLPFKKGKGDEEDDDGFDLIPDGNYPFKIPLPEGLPPSTDVDLKYSGISYQLVASLCVKGKKSILKGASKPTILLASASIILHKADILQSFPSYAPILPPPIPAKLPWSEQGQLAVGEAKESSLTVRRGFGGAEGSEGGQISMRVIRKGSAFGPGDSVPVFVELRWSGNEPIRLTRLDFILREQITFRYPSPNNSAYLVRSPSRTSSIFTINANTSSDSDASSAFAILYRGEPATFDLNGTVPTTHTRVTVRTAKHIDVAYHLKIRAMIEGGDEVSVDQWPVVISNVNYRNARGIVADIGYVEGLCERAGLTESDRMINGHGNGHTLTSSRSFDMIPSSLPQKINPSSFVPPAAAPPPPQVESPATYSDASTEKRRLLEARSIATNGSSFHVSNPTHEQQQSSRSSPLVSTPERPTPLRAQFAASPTAEEEKRRYYEAATKSRDHLQGLQADQGQLRDSPVSIDAQRYRHASDGPALSPTSSAALTETPVSPFAYQEASVVKLRRPSDDDDLPPQSFSDNRTAVSRSNTTFAASGSAVSTSLDDPPRQLLSPHAAASPSNASRSIGASMLGRSLTSAESEKKRLFLEAKEMARIRQEEARLELERQNKVLEDFEFEEAQRDFEERLMMDAEEERRKEEEREREQFERRLEMERLEKLAQFEREQREAQIKRQEETDRWARERKAEDEMKKRKAEELRRMDEQKEKEDSERRGALARKAEMERQRAEDEQRRLAGERARREEAERRYRAERVAEEEERRRQDEERRRRDEYERQLQEEEHRCRVEQDRRTEEENRRLYLARIRAEEEEALAQRAARTTSPQQAYPSTYGRSQAFTPPNVHPSTPPRRVTPALDRAPSVASFAPSMSAANADSTFYAQAIASGHQSALSQEKAEYLRQLRQGQSNGPSPPSSQQQHPPASSCYHEPTQQNGYASPPQPRSRSTTPTPAAYRSSPAPATTNGYKTAAEEKAEAAARRRAEEEQARSELAQAQSSAPTSTSSTVIGLDDDGDLAPPPSYPVPGSSVSHAPTRSAAEEKEELSAYYRAKQAVDNGRAQAVAPSPPARQSVQQAYPSSLSTSHSHSNGYHHSPPSAPPVSHPAYPSASPASSSADHPRDPEVSLGKQRAESTHLSSSSGGSYPESILRNYSQSPSAPLPSTNGFYAAAGGNDGKGETGYGTGVEGFGSFHLETQFPEFDSIAERIRRGERPE